MFNEIECACVVKETYGEAKDTVAVTERFILKTACWLKGRVM